MRLPYLFVLVINNIEKYHTFLLFRHRILFYATSFKNGKLNAKKSSGKERGDICNEKGKENERNQLHVLDMLFVDQAKVIERDLTSTVFRFIFTCANSNLVTCNQAAAEVSNVFVRSVAG